MNELDFWAHHRDVRRGRWVCWEWTGAKKPNGYGQVKIVECGLPVVTRTLSPLWSNPRGSSRLSSLRHSLVHSSPHLFLGRTRENMIECRALLSQWSRIVIVERIKRGFGG